MARNRIGKMKLIMRVEAVALEGVALQASSNLEIEVEYDAARLMDFSQVTGPLVSNAVNKLTFENIEYNKQNFS